MDLLSFERKLDSTITRKRLDIQEALKRPMKVLQQFLVTVYTRPRSLSRLGDFCFLFLQMLNDWQLAWVCLMSRTLSTSNCCASSQFIPVPIGVASEVIPIPIGAASQVIPVPIAFRWCQSSSVSVFLAYLTILLGWALNCQHWSQFSCSAVRNLNVTYSYVNVLPSWWNNICLKMQKSFFIFLTY